MANRYWVGGSASWDATAGSKWALTSAGSGGEAVPTSSDDVFLDSGSGVVTVTVGNSYDALFKSLNCTGFTGTLTCGTGSPNMLAGTSSTLGDFTLGSGMTFAGTWGSLVVSASSGTMQITTNGIDLGTLGIGTSGGGSITLLSDLTITAGSLTHNNAGTVNTNGFAVNILTFVSSGSAARTLTLGASTVTLTSTGSVWNYSGSNLTVTANTSTIVISNTSASSKTFVGGGITTYNNLTITGGGAGTIDITGANTFNTFTINPPKTVRFTAATTTTFSSFVATGTVGNVITILSITAATHTLSDASGTNSCDYLDLTNSVAEGGAGWYAGANSDDNGGNTGWLFVAPTAIKTINGLAKASVKTVNGLAIASAKTWNGLA